MPDMTLFFWKIEEQKNKYWTEGHTRLLSWGIALIWFAILTNQLIRGF